ncbi:hypothetical protein FHL15_002041 [Xylaria flabelliformis]|uniref:Uncharacterized protein n=1 Tax=Xylaria flabelliformis TaxID=2512241 RepID=A0A553IAN1_9PEZI|nr:hypothetical protein FHL15_002041 [Xylaria flabelliformis]
MIRPENDLVICNAACAQDLLWRASLIQQAQALEVAMVAYHGYFALRASAACTVYGVDYSNGGSYNIDASSDELFTFTSIFQGCVQEPVKPALVDPAGHQYTCTAINTTPDGQEVKSTCHSVFSTIGTQTQTLILAPETVTRPCSGPTTTVTVTPPKETVITTSVVVRTTTDATTTKKSTTTTTKTASCHYSYDSPTGTICVGNACGFPPDLPAPTICIGLSCSRPAAETAKVPDTPISGVKEVIKVFMATTVTVTETTYTVTSTSITVLPTPTVTENVIRITTATVTPQPSTVCSGQKPGATVSITGPQSTVTQTSLSYSTKHVTGTVTAIETKTTVTTNSKSATSCWINGGWMGAD